MCWPWPAGQAARGAAGEWPRSWRQPRSPPGRASAWSSPRPNGPGCCRTQWPGVAGVGTVVRPRMAALAGPQAVDRLRLGTGGDGGGGRRSQGGPHGQRRLVVAGGRSRGAGRFRPRGRRRGGRAGRRSFRQGPRAAQLQGAGRVGRPADLRTPPRGAAGGRPPRRPGDPALASSCQGVPAAAGLAAHPPRIEDRAGHRLPAR